MELNFVITIIDKPKERFFREVIAELEIPLLLTCLGVGTATQSNLDFYGLEQVEKAIIFSVSNREKTKKLISNIKKRMFIDVPGNGVMMSIPVKSVGGGNTLAFLSDNLPVEKKITDLSINHELVIVVLNSGYTDDVMDAARAAGATGGTVLHAKGTGTECARKFLGVSIVDEKEVILMAVSSAEKEKIMKAIAEQTGLDTNAGAFAFSMPITEVVGMRREPD